MKGNDAIWRQRINTLIDSGIYSPHKNNTKNLGIITDRAQLFLIYLALPCARLNSRLTFS